MNDQMMKDLGVSKMEKTDLETYLSKNKTQNTLLEQEKFQLNNQLMSVQEEMKSISASLKTSLDQNTILLNSQNSKDQEIN